MNDQSVLLTEAGDGRIVSLHISQAVTVNLRENATTGYRWTVERIDPSFVDMCEPTPLHNSAKVGSAGKVEWIFVAKAPGTATVALKLWRHWDGDKSIVRWFQFLVSTMR